MSRSLTLVLLSLLLTGVVSAQSIDAGLAIGVQSQESNSDDPRVLSSADVLVRGKAWGVHLAGEYADLEQIGAMTAIHVNVAYRRVVARNSVILFGAGPTYVDLGEFDRKLTWNAEAEVGHRFGRTDVFLRLRQYDYSSDERFRDSPASPHGPAVYLGVRFSLKQ